MKERSSVVGSGICHPKTQMSLMAGSPKTAGVHELPHATDIPRVLGFRGAARGRSFHFDSSLTAMSSGSSIVIWWLPVVPANCLRAILGHSDRRVNRNRWR